MPWKIGNILIPSPIVAAPMAGISNPVFRAQCHNYGAGLVVSEMISDKALHYKNKRTREMCATSEEEHPVSLQLFGSDPETMKEASTYLTEHTDCDIIDINMGCPVPKVLKAHAGSYLLQDVEHAKKVAKAVIDGTNRLVSVKIRAGWDHNHINCVEIAKALEEVGVSMIAVHGRTRAQMYEGKSNNEYIKMVKEAVSIPVVGNGDIRSYEDMMRMFQETGCDAVMIGRGLLGKPFLIDELTKKLNGQEYEMPSYEERIELSYAYAQKLCAYIGEVRGMKMMRGMAIWYIAGMPNSAECRRKLSMMKELSEMRNILDEFQDSLKKEMV